MYFADRDAAAAALVPALQKYQSENPLILGISGGGVLMARHIADELHADMDVVLVQRLSAPWSQALVIGALSEFGSMCLADAATQMDLQDFNALIEHEKEEIRRRRQAFMGFKAAASPAGRLAIIVDDGIETGSTMISAIRALRAQKAAKVVVAAPIACEEAISKLKEEADDVVVLHIPSISYCIREFYDNLPQVSDDEEHVILNQCGIVDRSSPWRAA